MEFQEKCIQLSGFSRDTFLEAKEELFEKYQVSGEKGMYALAVAMSNCSRVWNFDDAFKEMLPLFTDVPFFEEDDE